MKTKLMCMVLMLAFALILSACSDSGKGIDSPEKGSTMGSLPSEGDNELGNKGNESNNDNSPDSSDSQNSGVDKNITEIGSVNNSAFSGKITGCYYADDNKIIVAADRLYLYDTQANESIASVDIALKDLYVQTYSDGYFVVGYSGDITGYLLNKDFNIEDTISFGGLLNDDFVLAAANIAVSQDGKQIAFGGLRGLYLYDISSQKVSTILNYSENSTANNMQITVIESLAFTEAGTLAYVGMGTGGSGNGFSVYGTVAVDNGKLVITRKADYEVEEMQKGGDLLIMPQSFTKNNGTLLMLDTVSNTEKMMAFSSSSEGKGGIFCSQQGKYVATSTMGNGSMTINIYDTASGKAIHTETVKDSNSTYFLRIPQILILDGSNTCIVVLGRGISEVDTLITTFGFEGE